MPDKTQNFKAVLNMAAEATSSAKVMRTIGDIQDALRQVGDSAGKLSQRFDGNTKSVEKTATAMLRLNTAIGKVQDAISDLDRDVDQVNSSFQNVFRFAIQGQEQYVRSMGRAEATSQSFLKSSMRINAAQIQIGRSVTSAMLPVMEQVAGLAEKAAAFAEQNPAAVKAVVGIGESLAATAAATQVLSQAALAVEGAVDAAQSIAGALSGAFKLVGVNIGTLGPQLAKMVAGAFTTSLLPGAGQAAATTARLGTALGGAIPTIGGVALTGGVAGTGFLGTGMTGATLAAGVTGGTLLGGAALGGLGYKALASSGVGQSLGLNTDAIEQGFSILAYGAGALTDKLGITSGAAQKMFTAVSNATGATDGLKTAEEQAAAATTAAASATDASGGGGMLDVRNLESFGQGVEMYKDFMRDMEDTTAENARSRLLAEQRFGEQMAEAERDYNREVERTKYEHWKQEKEQLDEYHREVGKSNKDFNDDLMRERADRERELAKEQEQRDRDVGKAIAEFNDSEIQAEKEYNKQRTEIAAKFGEDTLKDEQQHQLQMRRMAEDHEERLFDLAASRDALGIVQEMRSYNKERTRADEDFRLGQAERAAEFALQLKELQESYAEQRDERAAEFAKRQKEQADEWAWQDQRQEEEWQFQRQRRIDDFNKQMRERQKEFDDQRQRQRDQWEREANEAREAYRLRLEDQKRQYDKEKALEDENNKYQAERRATMFNRQLKDLNDFALLMEDASQQMYANQFVDFMNAMLKGDQYVYNTKTGKWEPAPKTATTTTTSGSSPKRTGRAQGGYMPYGNVTVGEAGIEFLMNANTTRAAEMMVGARLTQDRLLASLSSGGRSGGSMIVNVNNYMPSGVLSASERKQLVNMSVDATVAVVADVVRRLSN